VTDASDPNRPHEPRAESSVARLVRSAGARPSPTVAVDKRVRATIYQEYEAELRRRRHRRWSFAVAASIALLAAGAFLLQQRAPDSVVVARITRVLGDPATVGTSPSAQAVEGQRVRTGETLSVPPGSRVSLELASGIGVRVNESTVIAFESPARLRLERGTAYVETPRSTSDDQAADFMVLTAHGAVRHVGTRFEVRVAGNELRVRVREGAAAFRSPAGANTTVTAGGQLEYLEGVVRVVAGPGAASEAWAWAESAAPEFRIEGRSLVEALDWFAHELGLRLEFADETARSHASAVILHGAVTGLTPRQAIGAIMMGTDLWYVIEDNRILITKN